jgi:hypothetical protein
MKNPRGLLQLRQPLSYIPTNWNWHISAMRPNAFPFGEGGLAKQGRMRVILEQNHIAEGNK